MLVIGNDRETENVQYIILYPDVVPLACRAWNVIGAARTVVTVG